MNVRLLTEHHLQFLSLKGAVHACLSLHMSKCHIVGNHMSWLISTYFVLLVGLGNLRSVSGTPEFDLELVYSPYLLEDHTV